MPQHTGTAPAQIDCWLQKLGGALSASSTTPLQSSSLPLQVSLVGGLTGQVYSQPLAGFLSRSAKPGLQVETVHLPAAQPAMAFGTMQFMPHAPQLSGSVWRLKPSSIWPSQLSSTLL